MSETSGSRVNITLEDNKLLPEIFKNMDNSEEVGNIESLIDGTFVPPEAPVQIQQFDNEGQGVDQSAEDGYTGSRSQTSHFSEDSQDGLPDLDLMARSFLEDNEESGEDVAEQSEPVRKPLGNKPQTFKGDFNAKELAAGIQTMIKEAE